MGIFGGLFQKTEKGEKKEENTISWIPLEHMEQLEDIIDKSNKRPQLIFKHSTTCGISRMVLNMFNTNYWNEVRNADAYFLNLHAYRAISNEVEKRFGVVHQSPQLLIVKNESVVFHTSHGAITEVDIKKFI